MTALQSSSRWICSRSLVPALQRTIGLSEAQGPHILLGELTEALSMPEEACAGTSHLKSDHFGFKRISAANTAVKGIENKTKQKYVTGFLVSWEWKSEYVCCP